MAMATRTALVVFPKASRRLIATMKNLAHQARYANYNDANQ
jgi:hypothetical protein